MKNSKLSSVAVLSATAIFASALPAPAHPAPYPHTHPGGVAVAKPPGRPPAAVVRAPGPRAVVARPGGAVVVRPGGAVAVRRGYYAGPRRAFVLRRGPWIGITLRAAPYYYDYPRFERYPVEVAVQVELKRDGYYRGPIDGIVGPGTHTAIANFQSDHGMRPTGRIDNELLEALDII